jgi:hypothetical protein
MIDEHTRRRLLEADMAELEGRGDSELARRVREDPDIRAAARQLTTAMREADRAMAQLADAASTRIPIDPAQPALAAHTATGRSRLARPVLAGLGLAAAVVATVLLTRPEVEPAAELASPARPLTASLEVSSSRPFAVFATDNPDIAVVWLFEEEEL